GSPSGVAPDLLVFLRVPSCPSWIILFVFFVAEGVTMLQVQRFLEMVRFGHTLFALPFALFSAALAWFAKEQGFSWLELAGIRLCRVFAGSGAMAFTRLAARDTDPLNPRPAGRPPPAGLLSVRGVVVFLAICAAGFIASTALFLLAEPSNPWPLF